MKVRVFCDDCPARFICETRDDCSYARYVAEVVANAPPLQEWQIQRVASILATAGQIGLTGSMG